MSVLPPLKNVQQQPGISAAASPGNGVFHIEDVFPCVDDGRFPVKRIAGEPIEVWADIFRGGHDIAAAAVLWRLETEKEWSRAPMRLHGNDRWTGTFTPQNVGRHLYVIEAWTDAFATWRHGVMAKMDAGQDVSLDALEGAAMMTRADPHDKASALTITAACEAFLQDGDIASLLSDEVEEAMATSQPRTDLTQSKAFPLMADRSRAVDGAWYEMIPRSQGSVPGEHGTFRDCIARLPDIEAMGFDVLYFTPIHPIGHTNRKGRNNALKAAPGDPGSPYAIGDKSGGHDAIHPELGTLDDFRDLVREAKARGLEIALDFAVQCSPDHPWLKQHPNWFKRRPDGSMRYAENPPKKYEDIHNPDFESDDAQALWHALRDVIRFWIDHGVAIFRIDNPHTKPFPFWEWLIRDIQLQHPNVIFLAEAFTRPKLMKGLAKLGFSQSYTYFTWRTSKWEMQEYLSELTGYPEREYYRPNFFVNTPDILPFHLQGGEPWMFKSRVALAAMLSASYGIYNGFELLEYDPIPGKEEYLNSEKYEIKVRDWNAPGNIKDYITSLNRARRANAALRQTARLNFLTIDDDAVLGFSKSTSDESNVVVGAIAMSRDPRTVWLPLGGVNLRHDNQLRPVAALENIITGERHGVEWGGIHLRIDPARDPAALFRCLA
ncbi:alpha-1,4-glucan--maltose-1-phosphate maltosyltransferase [[Pseudomonas] carboxydohydrogena]|uniref:Alpha-1,4-glucan:maltose-1-phosphate maltosyltransferase n=1 Tax=Afipia carboxydohydrogena TaxID=290 RepID=A0ABY8BLN6_AFICR|nr:alpha-1,4-glucan--maltose-1-phosphate maltosyltransferase [[Pseudomonas] carboxydohydrogena]WEF50905.1 alpha-1,4-glucan--maltose-1-phosphate maltosyltransferase [[Pseudomonas] carboxydohydrogena]